MSCALAGAVLRRLGYAPPQIVRTASALTQALSRGDLDVLLIDAALPGLDATTLQALRRDAEDLSAAPPIWIAMAGSAAAPMHAISLHKPLQREAVQAVLETLDHHAETWIDLIRLFGHAGVREMLTALKSDLQLQREVLAPGPSDPLQLGGIAHRLRGAALQLGAHNLAAHGARAEQLAVVTSDADIDVDANAAQSRSRLLRMLDRFDTLVRYLERQLEH